jgi:hypothetical protein
MPHIWSRDIPDYSLRRLGINIALQNRYHCSFVGEIGTSERINRQNGLVNGSSEAVDELLAGLAQVHDVEQDYLKGSRFGELDPSQQVQAVAKTTGQSVAAVLDQMGWAVARGFVGSELSYQFCDDLVNHLFGLFHEAEPARDSVFWEVYLAFDAGESRNSGDDARIDPVEKYTRPLIRKILLRSVR